MDPTPESLRILLVGDDPLARGAVRGVLHESIDIAVVGEIGFDVALAPAVLSADAEALLWDLGLAEAEPMLPVKAPVPFVALVADGDGAQFALRRGAQGVLLRDGDGDRMASALRAAMDGLITIDDRLADALLLGRQPEPLAEPMTPREIQVLEQIAEGLSNRQIGERLGISEHTAKFHAAAILGKLGAATRTEAVVRAARAGLLRL